jgi:DNA polymerase-3 subunit beta
VSTLSVHSGRSRATICGLHASEFPEVAVATSVEGSDVVALSLASSTLAALLTRVAFAASTDAKREPILTGVLVQVSGGSLVLAARDAYRLACSQVALGETVTTACAAVIPAGAALETARTLTAVTPGLPVTLVIDGKRVLASFHLPDFVLSSRLLVGDYPMGFQRHLQQTPAWRAVVATKHLAAALKSVASLARGDGDLVTLSLGQGTGISARGVSVAARALGLGEQEEEVETVSFEGESGIQLLLKLPQLAQIVGAAGSPFLAVEVCAPREPVVVRPVGDENALRTAYLLVPCFRKA